MRASTEYPSLSSIELKISSQQGVFVILLTVNNQTIVYSPSSIYLQNFTDAFPNDQYFTEEYYDAFNECMLNKMNNSHHITCAFECGDYQLCSATIETKFSSKSNIKLEKLMTLLRKYHNCLFKHCDDVIPYAPPESDIDSLDVKNL